MLSISQMLASKTPTVTTHVATLINSSKRTGSVWRSPTSPAVQTAKNHTTSSLPSTSSFLSLYSLSVAWWSVVRLKKKWKDSRDLRSIKFTKRTWDRTGYRRVPCHRHLSAKKVLLNPTLEMTLIRSHHRLLKSFSVQISGRLTRLWVANWRLQRLLSAADLTIPLSQEVLLTLRATATNSGHLCFRIETQLLWLNKSIWLIIW